MINKLDLCLMKEALALAKKAYANNEVPVGAVIYNSNKKCITGKGFNCVEAKNQVILHAEIVALETACQTEETKFLSDSYIYITLEPCPMCLTALTNARIKRIYYGAIDKKFGAIEGNINLLSLMPNLYRPECYGGFLEEECANLMKSFFKQLR